MTEKEIFIIENELKKAKDLIKQRDNSVGDDFVKKSVDVFEYDILNKINISILSSKEYSHKTMNDRISAIRVLILQKTKNMINLSDSIIQSILEETTKFG